MKTFAFALAVLSTAISFSASADAYACSDDNYGCRPNPRCSQGLCIGEEVINVERSSAYADVVAIQQDERFVLRFKTGPLAGQVGGNWNRDALAIMHGCQAGLCVGQDVLNIERSYARATIVGLQIDQRFVLRFNSGPLAGQVGGNWNASALVCDNGPGY